MIHPPILRRPAAETPHLDLRSSVARQVAVAEFDALDVAEAARQVELERGGRERLAVAEDHDDVEDANCRVLDMEPDARVTLSPLYGDHVAIHATVHPTFAELVPLRIAIERAVRPII